LEKASARASGPIVTHEELAHKRRRGAFIPGAGDALRPLPAPKRSSLVQVPPNPLAAP